MNSIDPSYRGFTAFTTASLFKLKNYTLSFIQKVFIRRLFKSSNGTPMQQYIKFFWVELACKHNIKTSNKKITLLPLALLAMVISHIQAQKLIKSIYF